MALGYCSDIDMFIHRKYDPSSLHERSNNIYPDCYVSSLLARLGGVSRTAGSRERIDAGKARGARKELTLMERSRGLDLRNRKRDMLCPGGTELGEISRGTRNASCSHDHDFAD